MKPQLFIHKKLLCFGLLLCGVNIRAQQAQPLQVQPPQDSVVSRFIFVGDAGEFEGNTHPVMADIRRKAALTGKKADAVFFLGDNVYPVGLPAPGAKNFDAKKAILDSQWIDGLRAARQVVFIPGNHDWAKGRSYGLAQLLHQAQYINGLDNPQVRFLPENGCPGPEELDMGPNVTVVLMDSQWWLQQEGRPGPASDCECHTPDEVLLKLKDIVYRNRHKLLLFLSHHPFLSDGTHGGYFTWKQHIFPLTDANEALYIPLPVIGSLYPLVRGGFGNIQDLKHPLYKSFTEGVDTILSRHPYCIRLAGHEHGLQYLVKDSGHYLISGAGSKKTRLRRGPYSRFNATETGYCTLELHADGSVRLQFEGVEPGYDSSLFQSELPIFQPGREAVAAPAAEEFPANATLAPAPYYKAGAFKTWLLGSNYREEWTTDVTLPVINIRSEKGGLTPTQRGGGMQSRSLRLEDSSGREWVLRSIQKYPDKTLPEELRQTFVKDAIVDGISASYPYAALSVPPLAKAAGVPFLPSQLVYLPDDPALQQYRNDFGGNIYLFEAREPDGVDKTYNSSKVLAALRKDNDNEVNQKAVLRARLLDMYIMDFDRHEDQWRWFARETKEGKIYSPIPRDRDQAFFTSTGVLPHIISLPWLQPKFQGFRPKARNINTFNYNARYFDRLYLTELEEKDWRQAIDDFIPRMTDSVIADAMQQQPEAIRQQHAAGIANTLKERRQWLGEDALTYYRFISRTVEITGSDKREFFDVQATDSGWIRVRMYKISKTGKHDKKYDRLFDPSVTKELRLYGMDGDDLFRFGGKSASPIKLRVIGGTGSDTLYNNWAGKAPRWYDQSTEQNVALGNGRVKKSFTRDPAVHAYDPHSFRYNILAPLFSAAYNPDDGVFLGAGLRSTRQGFRKTPYAVRQSFIGNLAFATGAFNLRYDLDAIGILPLPFAVNKRMDLHFIAQFKAPDNIQNFFGLGNETAFPNKGDQKIAYYRSRFNLVETAALLRLKAGGKVSLLTGPLLQRYWIDEEDNEGKFITSPESGLDQEALFQTKSYWGWQFQAIIDNRNNTLMPSRGLYWNSYARFAGGLNAAAGSFQQYRTDLSVYTSFNTRATFVIAARIGAGTNHGRYEFFQAQYLSGPDNLRGYRKFRFGGETMLYNNIDIRLKLGEIKGYILPASAGLVFFHDVGRVWMPGEASGRWHNGYGGGIWLAPAGRYVVTGYYAWSKDGGLPNVSLGFQF